MAPDVPDHVIRQAVEFLNRDGVILYPTDTVYGLGGDARSKTATDRIRRLKGNPSDKPLLVLTDSWERISDWIASPDETLRRLMEIGRSHSLTILFKTTAAPRSLVGDATEVGIRLSAHPVCRRLIEVSGYPISSTSANLSGQSTPVKLGDVDATIRSGVDVAIDGGELGGPPSTIVRSSGGRLEIVREGSLAATELNHLLA